VNVEVSEFREMPKPAARSSPRFDALARSEVVADFCRRVVGRAFPPCIMEDGLLANIEAHIHAHGLEEGARVFRSKMPRRLRALARCVHRNVERMKAGGVDLWAQ
jgi:hypothetical protein